MQFALRTQARPLVRYDARMINEPSVSNGGGPGGNRGPRFLYLGEVPTVEEQRVKLPHVRTLS